MSWRRALLALLALASVGLGTRVWWMEGGKYAYQPRKWGVVEDAGFFRSGQIHRDIIEDVLVEHEIDLIVDLASNDPPEDANEAAEREAAARLGIWRIELSLRSDGHGDVRDYIRALADVVQARREGQQVLVHCNAGRERTGTLVAMYRMLFDGWDGGGAFDEYMLYRRKLPGQPRVERYLRENLPAVAAALRDAGLLESVPSPLPVFASRASRR